MPRGPCRTGRTPHGLALQPASNPRTPLLKPPEPRRPAHNPGPGTLLLRDMVGACSQRCNIMFIHYVTPVKVTLFVLTTTPPLTRLQAAGHHSVGRRPTTHCSHCRLGQVSQRHQAKY